MKAGSNTNEEPINSSSSSNSSSISRKSKMKKFQLSKPGTSNTCANNNKRIGVPKLQSTSNNVDHEAENPRLSQIARLYEAKLRKIERIKPKPTTSTRITKFFEESGSKNDESDFDSRPRPVTTTPVPKKKLPEKKRKTTRSSKRGCGENFPDIRKLVNPNYGKEDENKEPKERDTNKEPLTSSQDTNETTIDSTAKRIRITLEQYGFRGTKNFEECDIAALFGPGTNAKRKKIRPTLLMKKDHLEQARILDKKVAELLAKEYKENVAVPISEQRKYETVSFLLEDILVTPPQTFYINSNAKPIEECMENYYRTGLFPVSDVKAGYLLKDWAAIPGRERSVSPELKERTEVQAEFDQEPKFEQEESVPMNIEPIESKLKELEEMEVGDPEPIVVSVLERMDVNESLSSVNQHDLDSIHARMLQRNSSLNGSCEDLFADFDTDIICTDTHSITDDEEEPEIVAETPESVDETPEPVTAKEAPEPVVPQIEEEPMFIPTVDMTQESSTPPSPVITSTSQALGNETLSGERLLNQIDSQLKLLSEIMDTNCVSPEPDAPVAPSQESCYVISSDSDDEDPDEIEKVRRSSHLIETEELPDVDPDIGDLETTVIYFGQDKSLVKETEEGFNFVENLVDQTIIDEDGEKSSDSVDLKDLNETLKTCPSPKPSKEPAVVVSEPVPFNDSYDEFDALIYGERKAPSPVPVAVPIPMSPEAPSSQSLPSSPAPKKRRTFEEDFTRLASLERKYTKKQEFKIKTRDVTPPPDYEHMEETKLEWEMKRFGLKFIKRREQQIQMLNHIYARTHPFIEIKTEDDQNMSLVLVSGKDGDNDPGVEKVPLVKKVIRLVEESGSTKRKGGTTTNPAKKLKSSQKSDPKSGKTKPEPTISLKDFAEPDLNDPNLVENDFYTSQFFQDTSKILAVKVKGKLQWCSVPLHIAFINVLRTNPWLKLKILQYEPIEIEVLYKYFKNIGARFELADLKLFFDKYCITFRSEN